VPTPATRHRGPMPAPLPRTLAQLTDDAFLDTLYRKGASSRAAIAKTTGISKPTISESAQRLLAVGKIVEVGQAPGNRGRSPLLYDINPHHGHSIGVALERGYVAVRAVDHKGEVIGEYQIGGDEDLPTAVADARKLVSKCSRQAGSPRLATAISVAAPVDPKTHAVRQLPDSPFTGTVPSFGAALGLAPGEPVLVDNDVNWASLAENRTGAMTGVDDFLYVYLGAGIGASLFLGGRPYRGIHGMAGEIAFLRMTDGDTLMSRLAHSPIGSVDGRSIDLERARALLDTTIARPHADEILDNLSRAIVNVATAIDPGHVVFGGPLAQTTRIANDLIPRIHDAALTELDIAISPLGQTAPLDGAAIGALELARRHSGIDL
jgi:predicted NBD/HSP70 family sugar kinase